MRLNGDACGHAIRPIPFNDLWPQCNPKTGFLRHIHITVFNPGLLYGQLKPHRIPFGIWNISTYKPFGTAANRCSAACGSS